jgi:molybdate transport system ATP-binding protein
MSFEVDVCRSFDGAHVEVSFRADAGLVALVGPSSGKTNVLNMVAGLIRPERGRISVMKSIWLPKPGGRATYSRMTACLSI